MEEISGAEYKRRILGAKVVKQLGYVHDISQVDNIVYMIGNETVLHSVSTCDGLIHNGEVREGIKNKKNNRYYSHGKLLLHEYLHDDGTVFNCSIKSIE